VTESPERAELRRLIEAAVCRELDAERLVRLCPRCGSSGHGRPRVLGRAGPVPWVSLAYGPGLAVAAWTWAGPIGVDVEPEGPPVGEYGDRAAWTRAEALLKATGEGLSRDPHDLPELWSAPLPLSAGWVGAVAVDHDGTSDPELSWRSVGPAAPAAPAG
jgi:phosphopantetheinyl transferase